MKLQDWPLNSVGKHCSITGRLLGVSSTLGYWNVSAGILKGSCSTKRKYIQINTSQGHEPHNKFSQIHHVAPVMVPWHSAQFLNFHPLWTSFLQISMAQKRWRPSIDPNVSRKKSHECVRTWVHAMNVVSRRFTYTKKPLLFWAKKNGFMFCKACNPKKMILNFFLSRVPKKWKRNPQLPGRHLLPC